MGKNRDRDSKLRDRQQEKAAQMEDYSTPNQKKRYVASQRRLILDEFIRHRGSAKGSYLEGAFGERRQKAILAYLDKAAADFRGFGLKSIVEAFTKNELRAGNNYNVLDIDADLRIGAAIWILERLRESGGMYEAYKILPDVSADPDIWYLPVDFQHPCFDNDLIQSVIHVLSERYASGKGHRAITGENALGRQPGAVWQRLMDLLPREEVEKACDSFRSKVWEVAARYLQGLGAYEKAMDQLLKRIDYEINLMNQSGSPLFFGPGQSRPDPEEQALELKDQLDIMLEQMEDYAFYFDRYLLMDRKQLRKETVSRRAAKSLEGFSVEDPYALCFALFYLLDTGDDAPWLMRSGSCLMQFSRHMLPWFAEDEDWDDEQWENWYGGMEYNRNGWLERQAPPEPLDYYHEQFRGKNLAQVIYQLCRTVVPTGLHPFEEDRKEMIAGGMEEGTARRITDLAELMFLFNFQARQFYVEDTDMETKAEEADDGGEPGALPEQAKVRLGGYWGKVAAFLGEAAADEPAADTLSKARAELEEARKQIKNLKGLLSAEKHAADAERAKYERELKSLRMEHRELADLRNLVFNRETETEARAEIQNTYPYETRKRTIVFGGHDSFLKAIRPMLPMVRFVDVKNLSFHPDIIRNADVVWIQNNCISHSQYYSIVKICRQAGVQLRYFAYASAEKCADQLVAEDRKG